LEKESEDGILRYLEGMMEENVVCAVEDGTLLGFVTYVKNHKYSSLITEKDMPNIYVCTLIVNPKARGRGLTYRMYDHLFNEKYADRNIFTRTWSTNTAHISILKKYNFREIHRIENDRGEGIDTVYFSRKA
jgi:ribosomal protein S18 acetylase RimI-like enzyme